MKDENQEILEVNQAFYRAFEKRDIIALHGILEDFYWQIHITDLSIKTVKLKIS